MSETDGLVNAGVMMLRDFQEEMKTGVYGAWNEGAQNVMCLGPTGCGKTVVMGNILTELDWPACATAHRQELVGQIALALNREQVPHGIIAPKDVIREVIAEQMESHGRSYYNPRAHIRVAGIDTLARRGSSADKWFQQVKLVVIDEGHHVLKNNKWGRVQNECFPTARGLYFTAHAIRADGAGLGRAADGLVDRLVLGPAGRTLIDRGFLTDYKVICPPSDVDMSDVPIGPSGEFNQEKAAEKIHASRTIVGDVVKHYKKFGEGELGITFAVDVQECHKIADAFNSARIPAAIITAKTPIGQRGLFMRQFKARQLIQLVNVDVLGEGTDVPACTVVSMARPTASFQLCAQQFGRMLRILVDESLNRIWHTFTDGQRRAYISASAKPHGILIDHVGNIAIAGGAGRHGLPDVPRVYSLDRRERKSRQPDDAIPLTVCLNENCLQPYERVLSECPHCGTPKPFPRGRASPSMVDGDLVELDPEVLRQLRTMMTRIDGAPRMPANASAIVQASINKNHLERQRQQAQLRDAIALWAGWQAHLGRNDRESYRRFFFGFGTDVATAQTLGAKDAAELEARIRTQLALNNVVKA